MDNYTNKTGIWLDHRFNMRDKKGIYHAHEPIYGFRKGHSEPDIVGKYINAYQIMKALSHLEFDSLLDVGAAEGYKAFIAKRLFGAKVNCSDLSRMACKRAAEVFCIDSVPADIRRLPFKDAEFDVVLCSETLEHVSDLHGAVDELLRVASKAVVITVPHEPKHKVDRNVEKKVPHGHIHRFDVKSFDFLKANGCFVYSKKMLDPLFKIPRFLLAAVPFESWEVNFPKNFTSIYISAVPVITRIPFGKETAVFLMQLDNFTCKFSYEDILFVILKDNKYWRKNARNISANEIMSFIVPYHYLGK